MLRKIIVNILFLILSVSSSCYKKIANKTNVKENIQQTKARGILLGDIPYPSFSLPFFFNTNNSVIQPKIFQL